MYLKQFEKPRIFNTYWTFAPGNTFQVDTFTINRFRKFLGKEVRKGVHAFRGPWILIAIDIYSRYAYATYIGDQSMKNVIKGMNKIFQKMGKPLSLEVDSFFEKNQFINFMNKEGINVYFYKPYEHVKNQLVERVIKTFKELMLKYIYIYGWPQEGTEEHQVNKILDAISWYYNHRYHHGIKAIPSLVFHGDDINRKKIIKRNYKLLPIGTIVYREPSKEHEGTYTKNLHRVYDFDPEPFEIVNREGIHVGKYEIRSLLTGYKDMRWYKPYELRIVSPEVLKNDLMSPLSLDYLQTKYGKKILENVENLIEDLESKTRKI